MPKIYSGSLVDEDDLTQSTKRMISELIGEQRDLFTVKKPFTKLRIETLLVGDTQMLSISHNGEPLSEETLAELNYRLEKTFRQRANPGGLGGNTIAANLISEYGGRISIHNLPNGEYSVDTIVTLPVPNDC